MKDLYENGGAAGVDPDLEALTDCSSTHYSRKWVRSLVLCFWSGGGGMRRMLASRGEGGRRREQRATGGLGLVGGA